MIVIDPEGRICDGDKYFWVQAESIAAAALLAVRSGDAAYWDWYDRLWAYSWRHFVDHDNGAWYRILTRDNRKYSDEKSPAGKVDYHTMGACYDVLDTLGQGARRLVQNARELLYLEPIPEPLGTVAIFRVREENGTVPFSEMVLG